MSLKLWNYSRGYVIIEVEGFSKERFLNLVANKNIYVWDIRQKKNVLEMKVSVKGYKQLKPLWKKANVKVKIVEKIGVPFHIYKYRRRKILFTGIVFFVLTLYTLSSFIWKINIYGNERIANEDINNFLKENNIVVGSLKRNIVPQEVETSIMKKFPDFSWVSLRKKGTTLEIAVAENIEKKEIIDRDTPCDIIAKKDGIIDSIATSEGDAVVGIGDVVKKGDVLVKSEVYLREDQYGKHYTYVHADADIIAKTYVKIDFTVPKVVTIRKYTGKNEVDYSITVFEKNLKFSYHKQKFENSLFYTDMKQLKFGEEYPLPIVFVKHFELETNDRKKELTENEMMEHANKTITNKIISDLDFEVDVINKVIDYEFTDEGLKVSGYLEVLEEIDEKHAIQIPEIEYNENFENS